jgi:hypothetical protein
MARAGVHSTGVRGQFHQLFGEIFQAGPVGRESGEKFVRGLLTRPAGYEDPADGEGRSLAAASHHSWL